MPMISVIYWSNTPATLIPARAPTPTANANIPTGATLRTHWTITNIAETVHYEITGDEMIGERPRGAPGETAMNHPVPEA